MPTRDDVVAIAVDGGHIAGTLVTPKQRMPGVLFVHGWGGSQTQYLARAREIAALGCVCLTFDLTGHAATQPLYETVSRKQNLRDLVAAYDLLVCQRNVDPAAIAVVGSSYGGYLAAILSAMRAIRWLALRAPALYIDTGWELPKLRLHKEQNLVEYRKSFVPASENRALRDCSAFQGDVLVVESEFDEIIPHAVVTSYVEAFVQAHSKTYRMLKGADHGLTEDKCQRAYTTVLVNWLREMLFGAEEEEAEAKAKAAEPMVAEAAAKPSPEAPPKRVE